MNPADLLKVAVGSLLCPQACVLCSRWVVNSQLSPLCASCLGSMHALRGPFCCQCGVPVPGNLLDLHAICSGCREGRFSFSKARAWGLYEGELRRIIQAFKFEGYSRLAAPLSDLLLDCQVKNFGDADWILPVPLHPKRRRERGFDQTLLLAKSLSHKADIPLARCLHRTRYTLPQFGLDHESRRRNIREAFKLSRYHELTGKRVLIVDDVMTTGSTVEEISRVLRRWVKPKDVQVLTIARVSKLV